MKIKIQNYKGERSDFTSITLPPKSPNSLVKKWGRCSEMELQINQPARV